MVAVDELRPCLKGFRFVEGRKCYGFVDSTLCSSGRSYGFVGGGKGFCFVGSEESYGFVDLCQKWSMLVWIWSIWWWMWLRKLGFEDKERK